MTTNSPSSPTVTAGPPSKHQLAVMIWLAVFPTLTVLNLALGDWLRTLTPVLRTFVLALSPSRSSSTPRCRNCTGSVLAS